MGIRSRPAKVKNEIYYSNESRYCSLIFSHNAIWQQGISWYHSVKLNSIISMICFEMHKIFLVLKLLYSSLKLLDPWEHHCFLTEQNLRASARQCGMNQLRYLFSLVSWLSNLTNSTALQGIDKASRQHVCVMANYFKVIIFRLSIGNT